MYVVAGVSRHTGRAVATSLLQKGFPVRVLVRSADKGEEWRTQGAEVAVGSLDDSVSLSKALKGATGIYCLVPSNLTTNDLFGDYARFTNAICEAIRQNPVRRGVFLSTWGAHRQDGPFTMHLRSENALKDLKTPFTFVRASYFMENSESMIPSMRDQGILHSFMPAEQKLPTVSVLDIGRVAADCLTQDQGQLKIVELTGPAEYSMQDVANVYGRVLGRTVMVAPVPLDAIVPAMTQMGASNEMAKFYKNMVIGFQQGRVDREGGSAHFMRGTVTLDEAIAESFRVASGNRASVH